MLSQRWDRRCKIREDSRFGYNTTYPEAPFDHPQKSHMTKDVINSPVQSYSQYRETNEKENRENFRLISNHYDF